MKKILLVDDDALVLELYRKTIAGGGYEVRTATDGLEAIKVLGDFTPDFIVLDLMMPRLSGTDVLKFIRANPTLAKIPVAVLTNAFMSDQAQLVNTMGVNRAIVKGDCTPAKMLEIVNEVVQGQRVPATAPEKAVAVEATAPAETFPQSILTEFQSLQVVSDEFALDPAAAGRAGQLQEFSRLAHQLSNAAGQARYSDIALLSSALEALLFELGEKPQLINPSTTRTVTMTVEFLGVLIRMAQTRPRLDVVLGEVLAVDDDPLANRITLIALNRTKVNAQAVEDPLAALELLAQKKFDLVLLDVEMPGLNGFELCQRLRELPGYEHTPVIYVTAHSSFESRTRVIGVGGNDLIAKPIFPIELAVKVLMHLIRVKLDNAPASTAQLN